MMLKKFTNKLLARTNFKGDLLILLTQLSDIHPLVLGEGIKLFDTHKPVQLIQTSSKELKGDLVQIHFIVHK